MTGVLLFARDRQVLRRGSTSGGQRLRLPREPLERLVDVRRHLIPGQGRHHLFAQVGDTGEERIGIGGRMHPRLHDLLQGRQLLVQHVPNPGENSNEAGSMLSVSRLR